MMHNIIIIMMYCLLFIVYCLLFTVHLPSRSVSLRHEGCLVGLCQWHNSISTYTNNMSGTKCTCITRAIKKHMLSSYQIPFHNAVQHITAWDSRAHHITLNSPTLSVQYSTVQYSTVI